MSVDPPDASHFRVSTKPSSHGARKASTALHHTQKIDFYFQSVSVYFLRLFELSFVF
ncbi:ATP phosphoribosyltransferase [Oceanobacillus iheyensis HTE831]|uniref:ATP phosphoribosyltransferase n=1 Tax=Oceanobacillus iheyensis (strain DSM 14371 / CIP 107618 / JCM 11309 / KCTC 3954 / HTE831) TaxID=221109 RepID=Q8ERZ3_OCEIH|nr:ATP phosphoribosyltransferase [Oceanobacillus iheyensis HTE831]